MSSDDTLMNYNIFSLFITTDNGEVSFKNIGTEHVNLYIGLYQ